jgi:hypothetical protein
MMPRGATRGGRHADRPARRLERAGPADARARPERTRLVDPRALFTAVALWLRATWLPRRVLPGARLRFLRNVCAYVSVYYMLWAASDLLVLAASLDAGWLLRVVPNQLYYSFWVPFVWFRYASRR